MKKKSLFNLAFVCLCFLFNGCNSPKPTFQDFIGTWVSEDGGEIILRSDSTCVLKNIHNTYIDINSNDKPLNYEGKWILREKDDLEYDKYNHCCPVKDKRISLQPFIYRIYRGFYFFSI